MENLSHYVRVYDDVFDPEFCNGLIQLFDFENKKDSQFLVMFAYLNDVEEGGLTRFKSEVDFTVKPKQGRIVVFPPMFMYPHIGEKPVSGPKYILSTYVHCV